jgi:predicted metal-dependent HD superfamily phosphohydrolase
MKYKKVRQEAEKWIKAYFAKKKNVNLLYHNDFHTFQVVEAANIISEHYQLSEEDAFIVNIAAWFHDAGYLEDTSSAQHEERGANLAFEFLENHGIDISVSEQIKGCIMATQMPQAPHTLLEKIVCDADLFHLGNPDFKDRSKLMRKEAEAVSGKKISKEDWRKSTINLFEKHHYHTDYVQILLNDQKQTNLGKLKEKEIEKPSLPTLNIPTEPPVVIEKPFKKEKENQPSKGIETMFRITSGNNQKLSDMADNKAQILITVNSIILSAIISLLLRKLEESSYLSYPTFALLVVAVVTIVISILATRPSIPAGTFSIDDIEKKKVNLLFFGNFYNMNLEEYTHGMKQVMDDRDFLYETLIKDVYFQGVVLGRKYHLLRLAYNVFMFGLIGSVLGFIVVSLIYK